LVTGGEVAARGRTPVSFRRVLDGGDAMTGIRMTGRARERESPPRLLPDGGVEDGWRGYGGGELRVALESSIPCEKVQSEGVKRGA
jgi:hypothetical protein